MRTPLFSTFLEHGDIDDATTNILAEWMNESSDDDEEIAAGSEFEEEIDSLNESDHNSDTDQEKLSA
ncbi:hypothetical protein QE152_g13285 [Popillia japonica]|uniref:Uncharacterized protein n=1 Tax=Popillia japonica TaxID=7064 RepID=A0AAW1LDQ8_POPJA